MDKTLKEYRKKNELTQVQMAKLLNVTANTYRNWEQGANEPNEENLIKIQELLKNRGL